MKRKQNLQLSPEDIRLLKLVRLRLKRRLNKIAARLNESTFTNETDDINFALLEYQIVNSRLERMDTLLELARTSRKPKSA